MPHIRHQLVIGATAETVYNALTSREGLCAWWSPDVIAEAKEGSIARFTFGPTYFKEMQITKLQPFVQVKWTCITGAEEWVGTHLCFNLVSGNKDMLLNTNPEMADQLMQSSYKNLTLLTLQHDDWKEYTPMFAECNYTWGQFLKSLKLFCETGNGSAWPKQHRS